MGLRSGWLGIGCWLCLACGNGERVRPAPSLVPEGPGGAAGSEGSGEASGGAAGASGAAGNPAGAGGAGGLGGAGPGGLGGSGNPSGLAGATGLGVEGACPCDAGGASSDAGAGGARSSSGGGTGDGGACGARGPDGQRLVTLAPDSIEVFDLPIGSTRVAASGFDPCARVCASIIWDYSNNDLEIAPHCDDFLQVPSFPYVLVKTEQDAPCIDFWDYGALEPVAASGCFDPGAELVDVLVEVDVDGERYVIRASNSP